MQYPRTIRFDRSDDFVFDQAARAGELAVSGAFAFAQVANDGESLGAKARRAFGSGLLGTETFGWSTFVAIAEVKDVDYEAMIERLADHFLSAYGAPDRARAMAAARAEAEFAAGLCEHGLNSLIAVERSFSEQGIVERFKVVQPPKDFMLGRVWDMVDDDV